MKNMITKKRKLIEEVAIELEADCSAIIKKPLPLKSKDPGIFTIIVIIHKSSMRKALLDLEVNINLIKGFV